MPSAIRSGFSQRDEQMDGHFATAFTALCTVKICEKSKSNQLNLVCHVIGYIMYVKTCLKSITIMTFITGLTDL